MSGTAGDGLATMRFEVRERVGTITLARPEAMNALNRQLKDELGATLRAIAADREVGAVVLTGEGRAFSAGGDIVQMAALTTTGADATQSDQRGSVTEHGERPWRSRRCNPAPSWGTLPAQQPLFGI